MLIKNIEKIIKQELEEKHEKEFYDFGVSYALPVSIGNLNETINNAMSTLFENIANALKGTDTTAGMMAGAGISKLNTTPQGDTINPNTDSQSIIRTGDWSGSWKNTTITYRDSDGYDFSASPASAYYSALVISKIVEQIPFNPIDVSRSKAIPPHPFPSLGIGDEVMGQSSLVRDENNKPITDEGYLNQYTEQETGFVSDRNWGLRLFYALIPGGKAATDNHDIEMNKLQNEGVKLTGNKEYEVPSSTLKKTIIPSFFETLYGIPGTLLDFKNYGMNFEKIKDSYNNGKVSNSVIVDKNKNFVRTDWKK